MCLLKHDTSDTEPGNQGRFPGGAYTICFILYLPPSVCFLWFRELTFMLNSAAGFQGPSNRGAYSNYFLYVGFIPKAQAASRTVQGWRADNQDISFKNCDSNPNSYFTFYEQNTYSSNPYGLGSNYATANKWRGGVNALFPVTMVNSSSCNAKLFIYWHPARIVKNILKCYESGW